MLSSGGQTAGKGGIYAAYGTAALSDFLGDFVVFRSLVPADGRLPSLADLRRSLGMEKDVLPRKVDPGYGRVVAEILRRARGLDLPGTPLRRLVYLGDTRMSDGTAFAELCAAGGWPGRAFIGRDERGRPPRLDETEGALCFANRWSALDGYLDVLERKERFALDEGTALVIDIDKTAVGARGRNDGPVDGARVEALRRTAARLLGPDFSAEAFQAVHDELKQPAYRAFTADNQDCLAYVCLVLSAGMFPLDELVLDIRSGSLPCFNDFLGRVHERRSELAPEGLARVHDDFRRNALAGDPTPFKAFRFEEYRATAARFDVRPAADVAAELERRIFITEEVRRAARRLRERGVLVFGLSDKPDEASCPSPEQARAGLKPLHRMETLAVGERGA